MKTTLTVYVNSDDALLRWSVDQLADKCRGFAVQRELTRKGKKGAPHWLDNYAPPGAEPHQAARFHRSDEHPFRRFSWTDHSVGAGDKVRYRVVPVLEGEPAPSEDLASKWSERRTLGDSGKSAYAAYFNRGFVISQFMSRYLDEHFPGLTRDQALRKFKSNIGENVEDDLRKFLSGQLREGLLDLLEQVKKGKGHVFAALFEFGDDQLVDALAALGDRAHVVLANGSVQAKKGETSAEARKRDENEEGRKKLVDNHVDVQEGNRFISPGALGHNKFLVVTTAADEARRVWTGSTNWTTTGLCTQLNNGLLADDPALADLYLKQWHALRDAGSGHPKELTQSNGRPETVGTDKPGQVRASAHFTRAPGRVDLATLSEIVRSAKEGVLFLMFMPGAAGVLADVRKLAADKPDLLVRGVVSDLPKGPGDEKAGPTTEVRVTLVGAPQGVPKGPQTFDVIQPRGHAHTAAFWAVETTRDQFKGNIGHAIIHSKVLLIDPFSDDPTVVTGSHNFSSSASEKNDENFVVVKGDRALAEAYAVNVESAWRHYAGRAGSAHATKVGLDYLKALLDDQRREENFWRLSG